MTALTTYLTSRRGLFVATLIAVIALVAACSDPTPTPTATPTPTPAPTATPTPAPTATPTPEAMPAPAPDSGPTSGMTIDQNTLGRDLIALLSEEEQTCLRDRLGDETLASLLDQPILIAAPNVDFPLDCLQTETAAGLYVAFLDQSVGGLSPESRTCVANLFASSDSAALPGAEIDSPESVTFFLELTLCLTDEEAARMGGDEMGLPPPSQLRCVLDIVGAEKFGALVTGFTAPGGPPPEILEILGEILQAFEACGIDPSVLGGAPSA